MIAIRMATARRSTGALEREITESGENLNEDCTVKTPNLTSRRARS